MPGPNVSRRSQSLHVAQDHLLEEIFPSRIALPPLPHGYLVHWKGRVYREPGAGLWTLFGPCCAV